MTYRNRFVHCRWLVALVAALLSLVVSAVAAEAEAHRARLSRDLADHIAAGRSAPVDVIVSGTPEQIDTLVARYGARLKKRLQGGAVLEVTGGQLDAISQDPDVDHLSGDVPVHRMMAVTSQATGADQVWSGTGGLPGYSGRGIGVAVIDSGASAHESLRGRVVVSVDFTGAGANARDQYGHGTHVAGIVAGSDAGGYAGVAPGAHIVSVRVLGADGSGRTSDVITAISWVIENRRRYNIRIVNLSLGHPVFESYRDDPLCEAVQRAFAAGIVVVAAAGNTGKTADGRPIVGGVISPGNSPAALTVGALNTRGTPQRSDDVMATYSSRGPTYIDGVLKPDLVAPGNKIAAAAAAGAYLTREYPERVVSGSGANGYIALSGTSMASAVVAGAAALLLEANPSLTPAEVKLALQLTSSRVPGTGLIEAGAGSVNVLAAVQMVRGRGAEASSTLIAGERILIGCLAYSTASDSSFDSSLFPHILVWGNQVEAEILVWGNLLVSGNMLIRGSNTLFAQILVWRNNTVNPNILVWGSETGSPDILVWGDELITPNILVWGNTIKSDILIWGNTLIWGNDRVAGDILVWGN